MSMPQQTVIQTSYWWVPIVVVIIAGLFGLITACIKTIRKAERSK